MTTTDAKNDIAKLLQAINVLVVDGNQFMRKVARTLLTNAGVKNVHEVADGIAALEHIRMFEPDLVILDWDLPLLGGLELVKIVRSPGVFPTPDIPIIMMTGHGERWRVVAAAANGVNEFLIKPVSARTLRDRMVSIFTCPRPSVQVGKYYGPAPRKLIDPRPNAMAESEPEPQLDSAPLAPAAA
ncbi:MAG: response regulator [Xanthobacteraceae bacterium]|nr:MAG: response regulator [Xanthobacteraceae bacterium]